MTSVMLFFQMELAKCSDRYFSGRPVYLAKVLGSSVEEFVTNNGLLREDRGELVEFGFLPGCPRP